MPEFGKRNKSPSEAELNAIKDKAMEKAIAKREAVDPLIRLKVGAKELKVAIYEVWQRRDPSGIHVESILGILGSMAGFACLLQACFEHKAGMGRENVDALVGTNINGENFYIGSLIEAPMLHNATSVWGLVGGMTRHLGGTLPDVEEIITHTVASKYRGEFGIPRIPEGHQLSDRPVNYLKLLWPHLIKDIRRTTDNPRDFPVLISFCIQEVMQDGRQVLDPGLAAQIVMECAIPMSMVDPNSIAE